MLPDRILTLIQEYNPWWNDKPIQIPTFRRSLFDSLIKFLPKKQILAITGLRRTGKTVLMKQLIETLPDKKNILFFSFDGLIGQTPETLDDIIKYFLQDRDEKSRKYLFFDEIHKIAFWPDILKRYYDMFENIKFIISGSSSININKSKESLAGRIYDFFLPVLTFREFLGLNDVMIPKISLDYKELRKFYEQHIMDIPRIEALFQTYIYQGAFPEIVHETDDMIIRNYIKNSVIDTILLQDMPQIAEIKKSDLLFALMDYCAKQSGELIEIKTLADTLAVNFQTIKTYLFHLEQAFLINIVYNFSGSLVHEMRKNKKVYVAHPAISIATMRNSREILTIEETMGHFVKTIAFQHARIYSENIHFWRTPQKVEIDIILHEPTMIPVEVKYRNQIQNSYFRPLVKFMNQHSLNYGIMLTKHTFEEKLIGTHNFILIPVWMFMCCV